MSALDRFRLRLTAWYAGTFAAILLLLGTGLFLVIARQVDARLDRSVARAARELIRAAHIREKEAASASGAVVDAVDELRIPDRSLFLFDSAGGPVKPAEADVRLRHAARDAARLGVVDREFESDEGHTLKVHAERFRLADGRAYVAVAVADRVEIEDEYALLITAFAVAALAALALTTAGGFLLSRKSARPVQETLAHMRRFMADAAHELRTPITVLRSRAEVALQQEREPGAYAAALADVQREAARMGGIVDDLLTLARADSGERSPARERCFLDDIVLDAAGAARPVAEQRGVRLDIGRFEEAPIVGDAALVRQLAMIVLDNAITYTPAGGSVSVAVTADGDLSALAVEDTGPGIAPEDLPHIFERFYRGDPARGRRDGAGLGLAIAQWIVDAHGAKIAVDSAVGRGTIVTIRFPAGVSSS